MRWTELTLIPTASAMAAPVQGPASADGPSSVKLSTRCGNLRAERRNSRGPVAHQVGRRRHALMCTGWFSLSPKYADLITRRLNREFLLPRALPISLSVTNRFLVQ